MSASTASHAASSFRANVTLPKSALATNTPIVMPSSSIALAIRSCSSTERPFMPLSSQAVKPWSAANLQLLHRIVAGRVAKHAEVGRVLQLERALRFRFLRRIAHRRRRQRPRNRTAARLARIHAAASKSLHQVTLWPSNSPSSVTPRGAGRNSRPGTTHKLKLNAMYLPDRHSRCFACFCLALRVRRASVRRATRHQRPDDGHHLPREARRCLARRRRRPPHRNRRRARRHRPAALHLPRRLRNQPLQPRTARRVVPRLARHRRNRHRGQTN